jgi:hypothetical protein
MPVLVETTGETTTTWVLTVFAYTTVTGRDVTPVFSGVAEAGRHLAVKTPLITST